MRSLKIRAYFESLPLNHTFGQAEAEDFAKDVEEDLNPKSGWARVSAYCMLFLAESP